MLDLTAKKSELENEMSRTSGLSVLMASIACYFTGVAGLLALIATMAGLIPLGQIWAFTDHWLSASMVNVGLLLLFGIQHSVMARKSFKTWMGQYMNKALERSLFTFASGIVLLVTVLFWQPIDGFIWQTSGSTSIVMWVGFAFGWLYLFAATFAINHFDLFGLRQAWFEFNNKPYEEVEFKENWMYRYSRHPIMLGVLIGMWVIPEMTSSLLFLAVGMTFYIVVGLYFEERDLVRQWGEQYKAYKGRVGMLITLPWSSQ